MFHVMTVVTWWGFGVGNIAITITLNSSPSFSLLCHFNKVFFVGYFVYIVIMNMLIKKQKNRRLKLEQIYFKTIVQFRKFTAHLGQFTKVYNKCSETRMRVVPRFA